MKITAERPPEPTITKVIIELTPAEAEMLENITWFVDSIPQIIGHDVKTAAEWKKFLQKFHYELTQAMRD